MKLTIIFIIALIGILLIVGCGSPTEITATTESPLTAPTVIAESNHREWDYVILGDSLTRGLPSHFAEMLERDLGVKVVVHDRAKGGNTTSYMLESLRTDPELRQSLRDAEVVLFYIPWGLIEIPVMTFEGGTPGTCGGPDNQDCLRAAFGTYMTDADAIIAEIVLLRSPSKALIRTMDTYQFGVKESKEAKTFDIINQYWREANLHVEEGAARYNIPIARVYDAFMGANGTEDPREQGLVGADGIHTTDEGKLLMAELFRQLGYAYAPAQPEGSNN